jgi:DNA replication and repair protein RecF
MLGNTSIGPQKHDVLFLFKNQPAATAASRGENRSIVLALKNIEYQIKKTKQVKPLILLDDIMSELDEQHQVNLLNNFKDSQVIITSVNLPKAIKKVNIIQLS